ncbi:Mov34-domain-containing protein [Leucosporidium creatinivorum]|uniref:COP9 signalosome complex subunit 6 n=1 Tax=Leucosporidium creatinivorum TaxID=106004 RepID=A0A1Y2G1A0_9BASI|nr:Mov34-domain-containing protein [Leucosporidium creatinivorum]
MAAEGLRVALHPLPILNISEHFTRVSLQQNDLGVRVVGGLLGTQVGREVEIMNTFELVINKADNSDELTVDHGYFVTRAEQFKQVFPTFDFLGWYSVGDAPSPQDIALHKQFFVYNESPLFLQLSRATSASASSAAGSNKDLPVAIYESNLEIINNEPEVVFTQTAYEIETGEAERVAVDHASKPDMVGEGGQSSLIASLTTQRNAIKMLFDRVSIIVEYLAAVSAGTAPKDEETLRQISSLVAGLKQGGDGNTESGEWREEFMTEYNDVLLTTYLSTLTKQLNSANDLLDKQLLLVSGANASGGGGGGRGGRRTKGSYAGFGGGPGGPEY